MNLLVVLFIIVIVVVGVGLTMLVDVALRAEERILYGVLIGTMTVSLVGFPIAWYAGMSKATMLAAMGSSLLVSAPGWRRGGAEFRTGVLGLWPRLRLPIRDEESIAPLVGVVVFGAIVSIRILSVAYGTTPQGEITAGHLSTFGDWSAHLAYAASFAYADNFPPELPTAAGESFAYHFGIDWFSAMFVPLGLSLQGALQVSTAVLAVAFPGIMFVASRRLIGGRLAAGISVFVFLAAGGTAALYRFFFEDLVEEGPGVLFRLPRQYAFDGFRRNWLDNPVTGFLYPQRPTLIGFAAVLMGLALLWHARAAAPAASPPDDSGRWRTHLFVGVLTGIMPIFHVFSFGVLVVMGVAWAILERTRRWVYFLVPAVVVGTPLVLWQSPSNGADGREWHFGWVLGLPDIPWDRTVGDFFEFWLLNTGLFIPLVAWALWRSHLRWRLLPIFGLLLIPNIGIWHFWVGNNAKYVVFFLLLGAPLVGKLLSDWIKDGPFLRLGAVLMLFSLTLSGGLDIWAAFEGTSGPYPAPYLSAGDVLVGEWVRDETPTHAVFASANNNVHPVRALAGRTVVSGSAGRLSDLGVNWLERENDLRTIYGVNEGFDAVIAKYDIDYVVLGPEERRSFRPADAPEDWDPAQFWDAAAPTVYDIGGYKIYDVSRYQTEAFPE